MPLYSVIKRRGRALSAPQLNHPDQDLSNRKFRRVDFFAGWGVCWIAAPVTVRFPKEVVHTEQMNSCSSPDGRTSKRRSRTG